jgi:hypothetical protein
VTCVCLTSAIADLRLPRPPSSCPVVMPDLRSPYRRLPDFSYSWPASAWPPSSCPVAMPDLRPPDHNYASPLYLTSAMLDHRLPDLTSSSLPCLRLPDLSYAWPPSTWPQLCLTNVYLTSAMLDHRLPDLSYAWPPSTWSQLCLTTVYLTSAMHCPNTGPHFTLYTVYSTDALFNSK